MAKKGKSSRSATSAAVRERPIEKQDARLPGRSSFGVARAQRLLADTLVDTVPKYEPVKVRRKIVAQEAAVVQPAPVPRKSVQVGRKAIQAVSDAPRREVSLEGARAPVCKHRPATSRGSGAGRAFVPWCSRGKRK